MDGTKEMFLRMREADFNGLPTSTRELFTYAEVRETNEYNTHQNDPKYIALYNDKRKSAKAVQEYLFQKRHK